MPRAQALGESGRRPGWRAPAPRVPRAALPACRASPNRPSRPSNRKSGMPASAVVGGSGTAGGRSRVVAAGGGCVARASERQAGARGVSATWMRPAAGRAGPPAAPVRDVGHVEPALPGRRGRWARARRARRTSSAPPAAPGEHHELLQVARQVGRDETRRGHRPRSRPGRDRSKGRRPTRSFISARRRHAAPGEEQRLATRIIRTKASAAMAPSAPARFSTAIGWPRRRDSALGEETGGQAGARARRRGQPTCGSAGPRRAASPVAMRRIRRAKGRKAKASAAPAAARMQGR